MNTIHELGNALRARRSEMGLTQEQVAALSGLSRQTVCQVETGTVPDLGINKAERLASVLGLAFRIEGNFGKSVTQKIPPLKRAASTAGVSYRTPLTGAQLKNILLKGQVPDKYEPHLHALLDDAPVSLLAAVAQQLHDESRISRDSVWKSYRDLAAQVKSRRDLWR
jgi:transcriptional regulator with XRE-family HTH domain